MLTLMHVRIFIFDYLGWRYPRPSYRGQALRRAEALQGQGQEREGQQRGEQQPRWATQPCWPYATAVCGHQPGDAGGAGISATLPETQGRRSPHGTCRAHISRCNSIPASHCNAVQSTVEWACLCVAFEGGRAAAITGRGPCDLLPPGRHLL